MLFKFKNIKALFRQHGPTDVYGPHAKITLGHNIFAYTRLLLIAKYTLHCSHSTSFNFPTPLHQISMPSANTFEPLILPFIPLRDIRPHPQSHAHAFSRNNNRMLMYSSLIQKPFLTVVGPALAHASSDCGTQTKLLHE